jgi:glycine/D-amino acid oxidase-like deaminating enzyme
MLQLTPHADLRTGRPCWEDPGTDILPAVPLPARAGTVIIGAGVMGAMLAQTLAAQGHDVVILDRRAPAQGATAASTALVLWAADLPLTLFARQVGAEDAARAWRRVHRALRGLAERVEELGLDCNWQARPELYLPGNLLDGEGLARETAARVAAGLPSTLLASENMAERFGLPATPVIVSEGTFGVDPVALTIGMHRAAICQGARLTIGCDAIGLEERSDGIEILCDGDLRIHADRVILATGYEAASWYLPTAFKVQSSYAIATAPGTAPAWREKAMLWQAGDPYLYARGTLDGRIIIGGEDEAIDDATARDRLLDGKRGTLEAKGARLLGLETLSADRAWTARFCTSLDGLPAIGKAVNSDRVWLAYGYGGNGITFAALAAELLSAAIAGKPDPDAGLFYPYRFGS